MYDLTFYLIADARIYDPLAKLSRLIGSNFRTTRENVTNEQRKCEGRYVVL